MRERLLVKIAQVTRWDQRRLKDLARVDDALGRYRMKQRFAWCIDRQGHLQYHQDAINAERWNGPSEV